MATSGDVSDESGIGPDWGQVALVALAVSILALTAVAAPALGGAGLGDAVDGVGDGAGDSTDLPSLGEDGPGVGDDAGAPGGEAGADDPEGGSTAGDADGDGSDDGAGEHAADDRQAGADADGVGPADGLGSQESDSERGEPGAGDADADAGADADGDGFEGDDGDDAAFDEGAADGGEDGEPTGADGAGATGTDGDPATDADGDGTTDGGDAGGDGEEATFEFGDDADSEASTDGTDGTDGADGTDGDERDGSTTGAENGDDAEDEDGVETDTGDSSDLLEDGAAEETDASYGISFEDELTPGAEATATVTEDGEPLEGATVYFDGESVGTTDADGRVTGTVPFTTELEVTIDPGGASQPSIVRGAAGAPGSGGPGPQLSGTTFDPGVTPQAANDTFEVTAETALEVDEPVVAGEETTVTATVNDVPLPSGTVLIAGEEVGTTDDDGSATVTVPDSVADGDGEAREATVAVERDEIRAERTVAVRLLEVEVDALLALPGRTVDVSVTDGGDPIDGATIALAEGADADPDESGSEITTTENGTATVELPVASAATIGASHEGATAETTVDGLYRNAAILAVVALGAVALLLRVVSGRVDLSRDAVRSLPARLVAFVASLGNRAVDAVVTLADALERLGFWVAARGRSVLRALERALGWLIGLPRALADRGLAALAALDPRRLWRWVCATVAALLASSQDRLERAQSSRSGAASGSSDDTDGDSGVDETVAAAVRALWAEFVGLIRPPGLPTKTPGEVGRYAVEQGFPERPVRTVVDVFRDVEYGRRTPDGERLEQVRSAVDAVDGDGGRAGGHDYDHDLDLDLDHGHDYDHDLGSDTAPGANASPTASEASAGEALPGDDRLERDAARGDDS